MKRINHQRTVVKNLVSSTEYFLNFNMNYYGNCIGRNFIKRGDQLKIPAKGGLHEKGGLPIIKGGLGTLDETMFVRQALTMKGSKSKK